MSSTYRILCLSHDPAIDTGIEWSAGTDNHAASQRAAETPVPGHESCDLVVGQYSYPLLAVSDSRKPHAQWVTIEWLRLLYAAQGSVSGRAVEVLSRAWPHERLKRLRDELERRKGGDVMGLYEANCNCSNCQPEEYGDDSGWVFYGDDDDD